MERILGIDIGISSIGWALIDYDCQNNDGKFIKTGVRLFTQAENPKNGDSLAAPRRLARGARRRTARRADRMRKIKNLLISNNFIQPQELNNLYIPKPETLSPWELRRDGLNRLLQPDEWARVLTHIAKHRGFKSMRKAAEKADTEGGKVLQAIGQTKQALAEGNFRTAAEMLAARPADAPRRNKADSYDNSIPRELTFEETRILFDCQRKFHNPFASQQLQTEFENIAFFQKPIQSMKAMVGNCTFEPDEKRAPRQSWSAEEFNAWSKLNNIVLVHDKGENRALSQEEKEAGFQLLLQRAKVTFAQLRKALDIGDEYGFKGLDYRAIDKNPESRDFFKLDGYHELRKAITEECGEAAWTEFSKDTVKLDEIARALVYFKSDEEIETELVKALLPDNIIQAVKGVVFKKVIHLSAKALRKINPYLKQGLQYDKACELAGYDHTAKKENKGLALLPKLETSQQTTNPVLNRAVSQFRKVVNAVIRTYGPVDRVNIELARDLSNNFDDRKKIETLQQEYQKKREDARQRCKAAGIDPDSKNNLLKFRLWEEQDGCCIYTGAYIEPEQVAEIGYCEVDHVLPYSRSMDDSLNNKVLCLTGINRNKGNQIPFEYLKGDGPDWEKFCATVDSHKNMKPAKKSRLKKRSFDASDMENFKARNINDTRYISRFVKDYVAENLKLGDDNKTRVQVRSGSLTAFLRHQWGLEKNRAANDRHHAMDAAVVAVSTQGMVQYLSQFSQYREGKEWLKNRTGKPQFTLPWDGFDSQLSASIAEVFVSRAPRHKVTGAAHQETIRSAKHLKENISYVKTKLDQNFTLAKLEAIIDPHRNKKLKETITTRLAEFGNNAKKAFAQPLYMQTPKGKVLVRSIKIAETQSSGIRVRKGIANNGDMPRVDVFEIKDKKGKSKYYLVPVYVADFLQNELPNKAMKAATPEQDWPVMNEADGYKFRFSLYKDDLILINKSGEPKDSMFGYFLGANRATGGITMEIHDRGNFIPEVKKKKSDDTATEDTNKKTKLKNPWESMGVQNLKVFKKFQIDPLGNYAEVKQEMRIGTRRQTRANKQAETNHVENTVNK